MMISTEHSLVPYSRSAGSVTPLRPAKAVLSPQARPEKKSIETLYLKTAINSTNGGTVYGNNGEKIFPGKESVGKMVDTFA